jgi:hypothetical protein
VGKPFPQKAGIALSVDDMNARALLITAAAAEDVGSGAELLSRVHAGFGRIGRLVLRATLNRKDVNVVAINGGFVKPCWSLQLLFRSMRCQPYVTIAVLVLCCCHSPTAAPFAAQIPSLSLSMLHTCSR